MKPEKKGLIAISAVLIAAIVAAAIIIPLATILVRVLSLVDGFNGLTSWVDAVVYVLILLVILAKPQGLFGKRTVKKV